VEKEGHDLVSNDPVLAAISNLVAVLDDLGRQKRHIVRRGELIRRQRAQGLPYSVIVPDEKPPLIVERARESLSDLVEAAGRLQRAEALALYAEGMSMDRIGSLFRITRQRVADFVKVKPAVEATSGSQSRSDDLKATVTQTRSGEV